MTANTPQRPIHPATAPQGWILRVVLIYAVCAALWILLSDKALDWILNGSSAAMLTSTVKGWLFVGVTSLLLYGLLRRHLARAPLAEDLPRQGRWSLALVVLLMLGGAGAIGFGIARGLDADGAWSIAAPTDAGQASTWLTLLGAFTLFASGVGYIIWRQLRALALAREIQQAQAQRLRALKLLAAITDGSEDAIFAKDLEGRYILFNRAASRLVGLPGSAVLGRDDHALFPREQAERLIASDREALANQDAITREEMLDTPQGPRVLLATKAPLRDEDGQLIGIFGVSRDITRDKQAEAELRAREALFRTLFESAPVSILVHDRDTGEVVDANHRAITAHGYATLAELQSSGFMDGPLHAFASTLALIRQTAAEGPRRLERQRRDRAGRLVWEEVLLSPIQLEGVERVMAIGLDITERKAAEEGLRRQTERMAQRLDELKRFNRVSVGRELRMIELKQEINVLARELGREPPYSLALLDRDPEEAA